VAIKGKSRKRSKARGPALPPRPAVGARKTPLPLRREVKRAVVITLTVLAFLGGLRVWQNDSRADALEKFNIKLASAQTKMLQHFSEQAPAAFDKNVQAFTQGTIRGGGMIALAELWEKDFNATKAAVTKLKAPNAVAKDAKFLIEQGIDGYIGVVRLFNLAGQVRNLADSEKDAKQKELLLQKVQVIMQHADEFRKQRADKLYTEGATKLTALNKEYGVDARLGQGGNEQAPQ
jgi:hypothetical protein